MTLDGFVSDPATAPSPFALVEEISHRVVNEYAEAISSITLAARRSMNEHARTALKAAAERLRAHAEAHRALLPPAAADDVDLGDYLGRLFATLSNASLADSGVRLALQVDEVRLPVNRCWRLGLILAELVRNSARHGLAGGFGSIDVRIAARTGSLFCVLADDGSAAPDARPGRGSRLVQTLAAELGGVVDWRFTPRGSLVRLQIPIHGECDGTQGARPSPVA